MDATVTEHGLRPGRSRALAPAVTPCTWHLWGFAACPCSLLLGLCQHISALLALLLGQSQGWHKRSVGLAILCSITVIEFIGKTCENQLPVNEKKVVSTSIYYECFSCSFHSVACIIALFITEWSPVCLWSTGQTNFKLLLQ